MRKHTKLTATAAAAALVAGGAIATGGFWSAEGSTSGAAHRGWPVAASRTPAADLHAAVVAAKRDDARTLTVLEVQGKNQAFVDVGAGGESPGDYFLFQNKLFTPDQSRQVGRDTGRCILGFRTISCDATVKIFGKGKIVVSGALFGQQDSTIAITGGTGTYRTADGVLTVNDLSNGNAVLTFRLTS
jgi:hypothetical protein